MNAEGRRLSVTLRPTLAMLPALAVPGPLSDVCSAVYLRNEDPVRDTLKNSQTVSTALRTSLNRMEVSARTTSIDSLSPIGHDRVKARTLPANDHSLAFRQTNLLHLHDRRRGDLSIGFKLPQEHLKHTHPTTTALWHRNLHPSSSLKARLPSRLSPLWMFLCPMLTKV